MNKIDIINCLKDLKLPINEYWVCSGSAMVLYGLREYTNDIDLGCSSELADLLEKEGYLTVHLNDGSRRIEISDTIEVFENWLFDQIILFDGVPVITLKGLLEMKKSLNRAKDLDDIKKIENAIKLKNNGSIR